MANLDQALAAAQNAVPGCVAIGYVDMAQGMLLAKRTTGEHPSAVIELLGAVTGEMLQGPTVTEIERQFSAARGVPFKEHLISELTFKTPRLFHIVLRCARVPDHAVVFVCAASANVGMVSAKAKLELPKIEAAL